MIARGSGERVRVSSHPCVLRFISVFTVSPGMCIVGVRAYEHHVLKTSHYLLCQMPCKIVMVLFARCAVVACAATQRRRQPGRKESARRCSGAVALSNP